jgi:hypothetical protein
MLLQATVRANSPKVPSCVRQATTRLQGPQCAVSVVGGLRGNAASACWQVIPGDG